MNALSRETNVGCLLVVDDQESNIQVVGAALGKLGFEMPATGVDPGFSTAGGSPTRSHPARSAHARYGRVEQTRTLAAVEERQRLARELHDSVAQSLYSLTLLAEASRRKARSGEVEKVEGQITRLGEMAQQTLKEMRLLVYQLRPMELESDSLAEAIQHRLDAVEKRSGVNAQLKVEMSVVIPSAMENDLYRITQEALNNALKHDDATEVTVTLRDKNEVIELEITDNGKGFDVEAAQAQGGMGMDNIRERA